MKRDKDSVFAAKARARIDGLLDRCPSLRTEIDQLLRNKMCADLADAMTKLEQLEGVANHILRPATITSLSGLRPESAEFQTRWQMAQGVLAWLCVLAVKPDWIEQTEKVASDCLEVEVETQFGVQVLAARYQQVPVRLPGQAEGTSDIPNPDGLATPLAAPGYNLNHEVDRLILDIWRRVFPESKRTVLAATEIKTLDHQLGVRRINKTHNHLLPFAPNQTTPLNDRLFVDALLKKLPNLTVVRLKTPTGICPLLAASETQFLAAVTSFLNIPSDLSKPI